LGKFKHIYDVERKDGMNIAFLSVGGNLGNRLEYIEAAQKAINKRCGRIVSSSSIYETEPWGSTSGKHYLNRVIQLETTLDAQQLLKKTLAIEQKLGRTRGSEQNADRSIDIDLLFFNREIIDRDGLKVPHPRLHLRNFVLVPLNELDKNFVHPVLKKSMAELLKACKDELKALKYKIPLQPRYICIEGNIGSGKSTLAKALAKKSSATYVAEQFEDNALLPLFYADAATYAFQVEYSFLLERFRQLSNELTKDRAVVVSDFSIYKSLWFAEINLPAKEFKFFKKHFHTLAKLLPEPGLIVYLETSRKNLKRNIQKRGRPYEQQITDKYLEKVSKKYKSALPRLNIKTLRIRVKDYHAGLERSSIRIIENYIKENFG
jgi:deoxyguanosine kinase